MTFGRQSILQVGLGGYRASATPVDLRYKIGGVTIDWADVTAIGGRNTIGTITVDATGGTFTLTYGGQTTAAIAENAAAATVQAALQALSTIGVGNIQVTGAAGGPFTYEFVEDLRHSVTTALTGNGASLTGGAGTVVIAETQAGATDVDETLPGGVIAKVGVKVLRAGTIIYRKVSGLYAPAVTATALVRGETYVIDKHYFQDVDGDLAGEVFDEGVAFKDRLLVGGTNQATLANALAALPALRLHRD
ncbi:MAG: hypothetical protein ACO1SV_27625 [Fimbriimonas sp.]